MSLFVHPDSNCLTLLSQFCPKVLTLTFPFSSSGFTLTCLNLCWLQCQQRWNGICCCYLSHSSLLWEGYLLQAMNSKANINFASPWCQYPIRFDCDNVVWISCDWLNNYIQAFWMCHQVHNALYYSGQEWQNYDFSHSAYFTLYPFKIVLGNV